MKYVPIRSSQTMAAANSLGQSKNLIHYQER
jgi:hypothetical protein